MRFQTLEVAIATFSIITMATATIPDGSIAACNNKMDQTEAIKGLVRIFNSALKAVAQAGTTISAGELEQSISDAANGASVVTAPGSTGQLCASEPATGRFAYQSTRLFQLSEKNLKKENTDKHAIMFYAGGGGNGVDTFGIFCLEIAKILKSFEEKKPETQRKIVILFFPSHNGVLSNENAFFEDVPTKTPEDAMSDKNKPKEHNKKAAQTAFADFEKLIKNIPSLQSAINSKTVEIHYILGRNYMQQLFKKDIQSKKENYKDAVKYFQGTSKTGPVPTLKDNDRQAYEHAVLIAEEQIKEIKAELYKGGHKITTSFEGLSAAGFNHSTIAAFLYVGNKSIKGGYLPTGVTYDANQEQRIAVDKLMGVNEKGEQTPQWRVYPNSDLVDADIYTPTAIIAATPRDSNTNYQKNNKSVVVLQTEAETFYGPIKPYFPDYTTLLETADQELAESKASA